MDLFTNSRNEKALKNKRQVWKVMLLAIDEVSSSEMKNEHMAGEHVRRAVAPVGSTALPRYAHTVGGVRLCLKIHWKYLHRVLDALVNSRRLAMG